MNAKRYKMYKEMINYLDQGCQLINDYDSMPHDYGNAILYQAEAQLIRIVGAKPGITAGEIASLLYKTSSACSQLVRRLRKKGWIEQTRNPENNRIYNLTLTDEGWDIFKGHEKFEKRCYLRSYENLSEFSDDDFQKYIQIQKKLNETFTIDVEESKQGRQQLD